MDKILELPTTKPHIRRNAIEQIIIKLYVNAEKDSILSNLSSAETIISDIKEIYFLQQTEQSGAVSIFTRWGTVEDVVQFLNNLEVNEYSTAGLHEKITGEFLKKEIKRKKNKGKKKKNKIKKKTDGKLNILKDYIVKVCYQIENTDRIKDKRDLMQRLTHLSVDEINHIKIVYFPPHDNLLEIESSQQVIDEVQKLNDGEIKLCIKKINKEFFKDRNNSSRADELEEYLNEIGLPYGIQSDIIELDVRKFHGSDKYFGIKIQIGANVYLFEFTGTDDEFREILKDEVDAQIKDIIKCPFCKTQYIRALIIEKSVCDDIHECQCGARIIIEDHYYFDGNEKYSHEYEDLWKEACEHTGIRRLKSKYIDEVFGNIKYMGRGASNSRMWFLLYPWELRKDGN